MGMFACSQDQREMFEYLPTISFKAGLSKYALFIIGFFCELERLNGKKTLKNLVAILYYCFHWLVGFSIAVLCCTLQLILILIACLNISFARNIQDNSFSGIIPKHWPIYWIINLISYSPYKHEPRPAKSFSISTPKLYASAFSIK